MESITIEQFEDWSLLLGTSGLMLYMAYIIYRLAKESKAGKFGYFVLFFALGFGMFGFIAKSVIVEFLNI